MEKIEENHSVALLKDIPSKKLHRGDVGTVVVNLSDSMVDVEFVDKKGRTITIETLKKSDLIRLNMEVVLA